MCRNASKRKKDPRVANVYANLLIEGMWHCKVTWLYNAKCPPPLLAGWKKKNMVEFLAWRWIVLLCLSQSKASLFPPSCHLLPPTICVSLRQLVLSLSFSVSPSWSGLRCILQRERDLLFCCVKQVQQGEQRNPPRAETRSISSPRMRVCFIGPINHKKGFILVHQIKEQKCKKSKGWRRRSADMQISLQLDAGSPEAGFPFRPALIWLQEMIPLQYRSVLCAAPPAPAPPD